MSADTKQLQNATEGFQQTLRTIRFILEKGTNTAFIRKIFILKMFRLLSFLIVAAVVTSFLHKLFQR